MVDFKINETLQTGAVSNRTYRPRQIGIETEGRKCLFIVRIHHK